jgi:hypothetical protein
MSCGTERYLVGDVPLQHHKPEVYTSKPLFNHTSQPSASLRVGSSQGETATYACSFQGCFARYAVPMLAIVIFKQNKPTGTSSCKTLINATSNCRCRGSPRCDATAKPYRGTIQTRPNRVGVRASPRLCFARRWMEHRAGQDIEPQPLQGRRPGRNRPQPRSSPSPPFATLLRTAHPHRSRPRYFSVPRSGRRCIPCLSPALSAR